MKSRKSWPSLVNEMAQQTTPPLDDPVYQRIYCSVMKECSPEEDCSNSEDFLRKLSESAESPEADGRPPAKDIQKFQQQNRRVVLRAIAAILFAVFVSASVARLYRSQLKLPFPRPIQRIYHSLTIPPPDLSVPLEKRLSTTAEIQPIAGFGPSQTSQTPQTLRLVQNTAGRCCHKAPWCSTCWEHTEEELLLSISQSFPEVSELVGSTEKLYLIP